MEEIEKKSRSPQFPFIPLEKAIQRASEFEAVYQHHPARAINAVKAWKYSEKSSGGLQTIAALSSFGLLIDEGSGEARRLKLTPLALTILKDRRPGAKEKAIKEAVLNSKVLAEFWNEWGNNRPPDYECISTLHLDRKFTEDAAERFLRVYDDTIRYAQFAFSDKKSDNIGHEKELENEIIEDLDHDSQIGLNDSQAPIKQEKVSLMSNERVMFSHMLDGQSLRILVSGEVDAKMVNALQKFAKFAKELIEPNSNETN